MNNYLDTSNKLFQGMTNLYEVQLELCRYVYFPHKWHQNKPHVYKTVSENVVVSNLEPTRSSGEATFIDCNSLK